MVVVDKMPIDVAVRKFRKEYADKLEDYRSREYYMSKGQKRRLKRIKAARRVKHG